MKLISWNVNGLRACVQKGFLEYFNSVNADVFCIQESKLQEGQIELELPGYEQYWNYAENTSIMLNTMVILQNLDSRTCFHCLKQKNGIQTTTLCS